MAEQLVKPLVFISRHERSGYLIVFLRGLVKAKPVELNVYTKMEIQDAIEYDLESIDSYNNSMEDEEDLEEVNTETIEEAANETMGCQQVMYDAEIYASIEDLDPDVISQVSFLVIEEALDVSTL